MKQCGCQWPAGKQSAQKAYAAVRCIRRSAAMLQAEQLPVLRRVCSLKFCFSFAHGGGSWQQSEAELPVAGRGASFLSIGALVLKCAMLAVGAGRAEAKAVLRFRASLLLCNTENHRYCVEHFKISFFYSEILHSCHGVAVLRGEA